ncbi:MAG: pseudouridine synthase [Candidatus Hodgkinia cicadicola]|nr:MAG: pseudouridine synthase [Candidatus Hodgkinia cicadicola]
MLASKPKSVLVLPFSKQGVSVLSALLRRHLCSSVGLAHRLDYGTCGVLVAHKTKLAASSLLRQFWSRGVVKKYVCFNTALACTNLDVACAFSRFSTMRASSHKFSLLDCKLVVGKRHQIRLMQRRVYGDRTYCASTHLFGMWACLGCALKHQCLRSYTVLVRHPSGLALLAVESGLGLQFRYVLINFLKLSAQRF